MLAPLVSVTGRSVHLVGEATPTTFYLVDPVAGGVLVNSPPFDANTHAALEAVAPLRFVFYPSAYGARDVDAWRAASGARTIASADETIAGTIDERIDGGTRITGRLDFFLLPGRTRGTCALRSKGPPSILFFGPALSHAAWPTLVRNANDWSWENRVLGAVGIAALRFEFAFCDDYIGGVSQFGPGAASEVARGIERDVV